MLEKKRRTKNRYNIDNTEKKLHRFTTYKKKTTKKQTRKKRNRKKKKKAGGTFYVETF